MMRESYQRHLAKLAAEKEHQRLCEENISRLMKHAKYLGMLEHIEHLRQKFGLPVEKRTA